MSIPFTKVQSVGNHFVLIELSQFSNDTDLIQFVIDTGRHRFGAGTDGLLGVAMEDGCLRLRMFNSDGSEDYCGNGIRCAVHWAYTKGWIGEQAVVRHLGREVPVFVNPSDGTIKALMGKAYFEPSLIPLKADQTEMFEVPIQAGYTPLVVSTLTTGTAHTIVFVNELPEDGPFFALSPKIEHHELYPERTNLMWTQIASDRVLKLRIWERGVGETWGCGSGTVAAAAAYMRKTGLAGTIDVHNPGGLLKVTGESWDSDLWLEGKAQIVYQADWL